MNHFKFKTYYDLFWIDYSNYHDEKSVTFMLNFIIISSLTIKYSRVVKKSDF